METRFFRYGDDAIGHLKRRDRTLGRAIDRIGRIERPVNPDVFESLVWSIAGQQVSAKAAETVFARMRERFGAITPAAVAGAGADAICGCGISARKAGYIAGAGAAFASGEIDPAAFSSLSDEEIIKRLIALKGIGRWTAEMLLIFSLERPDIVSYDDLAIRRGMTALYGLKTLERERFERYRKRYSPYGSVASLYLWALSHE